MRDNKAEIAARYHVVELLYRGDIERAEQSLDSFSQDQTISPDTTGFYRFLIEQARKHQPGEKLVGDSQLPALAEGQTGIRAS